MIRKILGMSLITLALAGMTTGTASAHVGATLACDSGIALNLPLLPHSADSCKNVHQVSSAAEHDHNL